MSVSEKKSGNVCVLGGNLEGLSGSISNLSLQHYLKKQSQRLQGFRDGSMHACMYVSEKILEMFVLWEEISRDRLDQNQPDLRSAICKSNQEAASPPQRFQG